MKGRVVAALVGVFVIGLSIGALVGLALGDDGDSGDAAPSESECEVAQEVVASSTSAIQTIDETTEVQDINYFASVLVELQTAIFVMEDLPECFSIGDRARAAGFLEGVEASLRFFESNAEAGSTPAPSLEPAPVEE